MKILIVIFAVVFLRQVSKAESKTIVIKKCNITFETTGSPSLVKIAGKSENECTGKITYDGDKIVESEFSMALDKIDTGINLRNKHLRENYLHVDKHPIAKLKLVSAESFKELSEGGSKKKGKFEANLELHGKEAPVADGTYEVTGKKAIIKMGVDLPNYGVERPSFMGVKIVDKVNLTVNLEF